MLTRGAPRRPARLGSGWVPRGGAPGGESRQVGIAPAFADKPAARSEGKASAWGPGPAWPVGVPPAPPPGPGRPEPPTRGERGRAGASARRGRAGRGPEGGRRSRGPTFHSGGGAGGRGESRAGARGPGAAGRRVSRRRPWRGVGALGLPALLAGARAACPSCVAGASRARCCCCWAPSSQVSAGVPAATAHPPCRLAARPGRRGRSVLGRPSRGCGFDFTETKGDRLCGDRLGTNRFRSRRRGTESAFRSQVTDHFSRWLLASCRQDPALGFRCGGVRVGLSAAPGKPRLSRGETARGLGTAPTRRLCKYGVQALPPRRREGPGRRRGPCRAEERSAGGTRGAA